MKHFIAKVRQLPKDREFCLRVVIYFLLVMVFLGAFVRTEYATDTYADIMLPAQELIDNFLRGGRLITLICFIFFRGFHIPIQIVSLLSFFTAMCALVAALCLLEKVLRQNLVRHKYWPSVLSFLIIFNPFIIELFLFIEKGIMVTGILACVIAAYYFNKYFDAKKPKFLIATLAFVLLATFCYQGIVGLFIVLTTLIVVFKSKKWQDFFKNTVISVLIYALGPILNLIFIKIFSSGGRTGGEIILQETFSKIASGTKSLFELFGIMPGFCFWGILVAIIILWLIYCAKQRQLFQKSIFISFAQIIYLFAVCYLATIAPQAVQNTASIWIVPRSTYIFASFLGIVLTIVLSNYRLITRAKWWNSSVAILIGILLFIQFVGFNKIILDHYNLNTLDRLRAEQIGQIITAYETQNHTQVTTIVPAKDTNPAYSYNGIFAQGDINVTAFVTDWSDVSSINYWNHRNFTRQSPDSAWSDYCANHDWLNFDLEQIKFSEQTLYICWY